MSTRAARGSDAYVPGCLLDFYPGSWLPYGLEQIRRAAAREGFVLLSEKNGRSDYIRTMREWGRRVKRMSAKKVMALGRMGRSVMRDRGMWRKLETIWAEYNAVVFERGLFDHQRMVFARVGGG
jgi:cyclopropane-fatty-acyl-phospholipid synthase